MAIPHFQRQRGAVWKHVFEEWPRKRSGSDWPQVQLGTLAMSALGHVWTAPWQELSDAAGAFVGCDHVSGLFVRLVRPLALMLCAVRCRRGGAVRSSKSRCSAKQHVCLTPRKRHQMRQNGMSALCQKRTIKKRRYSLTRCDPLADPHGAHSIGERTNMSAKNEV